MPKIVTFRNPLVPSRTRMQGRATRSGRQLSKRALEIRYIHDGDGQAYVHKFKPGVTIEFLPDGSARVYRPDGKPVWRNF